MLHALERPTNSPESSYQHRALTWNRQNPYSSKLFGKMSCPNQGQCPNQNGLVRISGLARFRLRRPESQESGARIGADVPGNGAVRGSWGGVLGGLRAERGPN